MSTGKLHQRLTGISVSTDFDEQNERRSFAPCRCAIGADHEASELLITQHDPDEEDGEQEGEALSVYDAAEIWGSKGRDEDYMFGYSEDELRRAADED